MDMSNFDSHLKTFALEKLKEFMYRFIDTDKNMTDSASTGVGLSLFIELSYNCIPSAKDFSELTFSTICLLLENAKELLQIGTGKKQSKDSYTV